MAASTLTRPSPGVVVIVLAAMAILARLPFLHAPLSADEFGYLIVGGQWAPGSSLYGDYWVDRPPGLIALFEVASRLGGAVPLRLMGALAAAASTLAAGWLGSGVPARRWAPVWCAGLVVLLLSTPMLSMTEVDGEVLALPFALGGMAGLGAALRAEPGWGRVGRLVLAGALGMVAISVKQNVLDLVVVALGVAVLVGWRVGVRRALAILAPIALGGVLVTAAVLGLALARGTTLEGLWHAVVVFRLHAGAAIATESSPATAGRAVELAGYLLRSAAPVLLVLLVLLRWRGALRRGTAPAWLSDPAWSLVAVALLGWDVSSLVGGGGYWQHYAVLLVPGLTLLLAVVLAQGRLTAPRAALILAPVALSTVIVLALQVASPPQRPESEQAVVDYLQAHRSEGTTAVVAFGDPAILGASGMTSPYEQLWSLPVRVRDPDLVGFTRLMASERRPDWIVMPGKGLDSWGLNADQATPVLHRYYRTVYRVGLLEVLHVRPGLDRPVDRLRPRSSATTRASATRSTLTS